MGPVSNVGAVGVYSTGRTQGLEGSLSQLASGSRIPNAAFDAAGLAVNSRLTADQAVLQQGAANAAQGAAIAQVADGGLSRIDATLTRLSEIAAQSLSGTVADGDRQALDAEFQQLLGEIDGIAQTTRFNGESLLDGTSAQFTGGADFLLGTDTGDTVSLSTATLSDAPDYTTDGLGLTGANVATQGGAAAALDDLAAARELVSEARASTGALTSRFETRGEQIATSIEGVAAASSTIADTDIARSQSNIISQLILQQMNVSAQAQANRSAQTVLGALR